jgi:hypothetical protein
MQRLEVSSAVRPLYGSLGFKGLKRKTCHTRWLSFKNDIGKMETVFWGAVLKAFFYLLAHDFFLNFSTFCILTVNNTGTKYVGIMKQTAF